MNHETAGNRIAMNYVSNPISPTPGPQEFLDEMDRAIADHLAWLGD